MKIVIIIVVVYKGIVLRGITRCSILFQSSNAAGSTSPALLG
jgi:hypothetical protein